MMDHVIKANNKLNKGIKKKLSVKVCIIYNVFIKSCT